MTRAGKSPEAASPFFTPREWVQKRSAEIDKTNAARQCTPSIPYAWETRRDERRKYEAQIKALERALAQTEREKAKLKTTIESLRSQTMSRIDESVLAVLTVRYPRLPKKIHELVVESYGPLSKETIRAHLRKLVGQGLIERTEEGYVRCRRADE